MPIYTYRCIECSEETEEFCRSWKERPSLIRCSYCNGEALFTITPTNAHVHFTKKEVRIPSEPTKTTVPGNYSMTVDNYKVVPSPPDHKKQLQKNGRYLPYDRLFKRNKLKSLKREF